MRIESVVEIQAVRLAVTVGAIVVAPVLLVAGAPLRRRMLRRYYREDGPGLVSKEDGWVSPGYFVVTRGCSSPLLAVGLRTPTASSCLSSTVIGQR
ncbi:hypothetical protein ABZV61_36240 [Streptomyces sp900116325]|uniref:Uncharacterized protein n=1 Tax=Streptomyces sp. 900116325 TaxID=3154295 RepID=A0ABV2UJS9_9ACTN